MRMKGGNEEHLTLTYVPIREEGWNDGYALRQQRKVKNMELSLALAMRPRKPEGEMKTYLRDNLIA